MRYSAKQIYAFQIVGHIIWDTIVFPNFSIPYFISVTQIWQWFVAEKKEPTISWLWNSMVSSLAYVSQWMTIHSTKYFIKLKKQKHPTISYFFLTSTITKGISEVEKTSELCGKSKICCISIMFHCIIHPGKLLNLYKIITDLFNIHYHSKLKLT